MSNGKIIKLREFGGIVGCRGSSGQSRWQLKHEVLALIPSNSYLY